MEMLKEEKSAEVKTIAEQEATLAGKNQVGGSEVEEKLRDGMRDKSKGSGEKERRRIPYT